jgi:hypothetical protein
MQSAYELTCSLREYQEQLQQARAGVFARAQRIRTHTHMLSPTLTLRSLSAPFIPFICAGTGAGAA